MLLYCTIGLWATNTSLAKDQLLSAPPPPPPLAKKKVEQKFSSLLRPPSQTRPNKLAILIMKQSFSEVVMSSAGGFWSYNWAGLIYEMHAFCLVGSALFPPLFSRLPSQEYFPMAAPQKFGSSLQAIRGGWRKVSTGSAAKKLLQGYFCISPVQIHTFSNYTLLSSPSSLLLWHQSQINYCTLYCATFGNFFFFSSATFMFEGVEGWVLLICNACWGKPHSARVQ